jgi:hypothetical protein
LQSRYKIELVILFIVEVLHELFKITFLSGNGRRGSWNRAAQLNIEVEVRRVVCPPYNYHGSPIGPECVREGGGRTFSPK